MAMDALDKMEKRIELEKRGRPSEEIEELNLDNCRATQVSGLTDDFKNLVSLSLINVGLTTLKGFPNLPNLQKLELSDNRISGSLNLLQGCSKLSYLNLSGNKIGNIETLEPLKELKELRSLDLFNCEVTSQDDYREKVFEQLEALVYLDGFDRENQEIDDDDDDDGEDYGDEDDEEEEEGEVIKNGQYGEESDEDEELNGGVEGEEFDDEDDLDDDDNENDVDDDDDEDGEADVVEDEDGEGESESDAANFKGQKRKHEDEEEEDEDD